MNLTEPTAQTAFQTLNQAANSPQTPNVNPAPKTSGGAKKFQPSQSQAFSDLVEAMNRAQRNL